MGLSVLHPRVGVENKDALNVDIVAVHGLNGNQVETWTNPKSKAFWLQDYLPLDITGARVMSFGYNANVAFGNTTADILDHAKDLLGSLVDKREKNDETKRPIVFIAHSLGGIVVKQALFQARIESQYQSIDENTIGIVFLGTPHRGSEKASYGKVLANVANAVMNKPKPRLISALQNSSDSLMRLTSEFRHQLLNYQVVSFYELKPMKPFSTLIVEKHSALLDVHGEDQIPVDGNHRDICRFQARDDLVYEKLFKRILRMLKAKDNATLAVVIPNLSIVYNQHYDVPHNVSSVFTGREELCQQLTKSCLPSRPLDNTPKQKRFVLHGLGGSGKTQVCLKFAEVHREKFWGVFWIDASNNETAEQGFLGIARLCGLEVELKAVKRWLSNIPDPWLLIIDNADDPSEDVSQYFPTGNRGVILITTRNPDCYIHATVGSYELVMMGPEEAITLLLRTTATADIWQEASRSLAKPVVEILGYLPLAIVQAGAIIRQKLCMMEEYCTVYSRRRKQLLSHQPVQAKVDYKYTVYTTWEVSVNMIERMGNKTARNAIEILQLFSFMHYDSISEEVLKEARRHIQNQQLSEWTRSHQLAMVRDDVSKDWDSYPIREAIGLLLSFSLVSIDGVKNQVSMHPLVHTWARDRLSEFEQKRCWRIAASTLAMSISWGRQSFDFYFRRSLLPHVGNCLSSDDSELFTVDSGESERVEIAAKFALVFGENGRWLSAMKLQEKVVEARKRSLGVQHPKTLMSMSNLARSYSDLGRRQEAVELEEKVLEANKRTLGEEHPDTLLSMGNLARSYSDLGQRQEAVDLEEKVLEANKRTLGDEHPSTLVSMGNLAVSYSDLGRRQEAVELNEKVLETNKRTLGEEHPDTLLSMCNLARSYSDLGWRHEAMELEEKVLEARRRTLGDEHPSTLLSMGNLASSYSNLGRRQEAVELKEKVLEASKWTLGEEHPHTLISMGNLAMSYSDLGRRQEAMELEEKVLEASKRILGEKHPGTLLSMSNLASSYNDLGWRQEAMELEEKVLEARRQTLGEEHPDTLLSVDQLAFISSCRNRLPEEIEQRVSSENKAFQIKPKSRWNLKSLVDRRRR